MLCPLEEIMSEGVTCYERDEILCDDQICLRTGCRIKYECLAPVIITLPMPPSTNGLFAGKGRRYKSGEYINWIREAGFELLLQRPRQVPGRVSLAIEVGEPKTARATDLGNREKAVTDLLVSHGVIQGDDQRYVREITMRWANIDGIRITVRSCA